MDLIRRPKEVPRADKGYLSNEQYQDYSGKQFKTIYDYLDGETKEAEETKNSIEVINNRLSSIMMTTSEEVQISSNAGTPVTGTVTLTNTGYFPIGLGGITSNANKFHLQQVNFTNIASGTATVGFKFYNGDTSAWQTTVTCQVIWIKE